MKVKLVVAGLLTLGILASVIAVTGNTAGADTTMVEIQRLPGGGGGGGNGTR